MSSSYTVNDFYNKFKQLPLVDSNDYKTLASFVLSDCPSRSSYFKSDLIILACGMYCSDNKKFDYRDIQILTGDMMQKTMTTSLIYKTITVMQEKGMIYNAGEFYDANYNRELKNYSVTEFGFLAFKIKLLDALLKMRFGN